MKSGKEKRLSSNKSVTIYNNKWYDHATNEGGFTIDFIMKFYGKDFPSAISMLLDGENSNISIVENKKEEKVKKEFALPPKNTECILFLMVT